MSVWKARLICTAYTERQFPPGALPEIALAGRSNVGKSTLLNRLVGQKLARVGSSPGMTRSVNFFQVDAPRPFAIVDLPGYGYAERGRGERNAWSRLVEDYVGRREELALVVHLVDIRHGLKESDVRLQEWLSALGVPMQCVFTKADKIAKTKRRAAVNGYIDKKIYSWGLPLPVSADEPETIDALRVQIESYLERALDAKES